MTIGAKTKLRVNGVFDSNNNPIGGTWGDESAGDIISDDQEILIKADPLPQEVKIVVKGWGGSGIWKYRKHFHFSYDTQTWKDDTGDESVAHCKETLRLSAAEKRNRYKHGKCIWEGGGVLMSTWRPRGVWDPTQPLLAVETSADPFNLQAMIVSSSVRDPGSLGWI